MLPFYHDEKHEDTKFTIKEKEYDFKQKPDDGCYCYGFFFDGAKWSREKGVVIYPFNSN
jgi:hypothetical protein